MNPLGGAVCHGSSGSEKVEGGWSEVYLPRRYSHNTHLCAECRRNDIFIRLAERSTIHQYKSRQMSGVCHINVTNPLLKDSQSDIGPRSYSRHPVNILSTFCRGPAMSETWPLLTNHSQVVSVNDRLLYFITCAVAAIRHGIVCQIFCRWYQITH